MRRLKGHPTESQWPHTVHRATANYTLSQAKIIRLHRDAGPALQVARLLRNLTPLIEHHCAVSTLAVHSDLEHTCIWGGMLGPAFPTITSLDFGSHGVGRRHAARLSRMQWTVRAQHLRWQVEAGCATPAPAILPDLCQQPHHPTVCCEMGRAPSTPADNIGAGMTRK